MNEEEQYNAEVAELLDSIRCPICNAPPRHIEGVLPDQPAVVTCRGYEEHTFMINQEEE